MRVFACAHLCANPCVAQWAEVAGDSVAAVAKEAIRALAEKAQEGSAMVTEPC